MRLPMLPMPIKPSLVFSLISEFISLSFLSTENAQRTQAYTARPAINSAANCVEQASYQKAERRCAETDCYHLYPALTPISDQGLCRIDSHGEKRDCTEGCRQSDSRRACYDHEGDDWYEVTDECRDGDHHSALHQAHLGNRLQMQLFIHHRTYPGFTIGRDRGNDVLEQLSLEALSRIDLSNLLTLIIWFCFDLILLARSLGKIEVTV